jgi:hypothetical protein
MRRVATLSGASLLVIALVIPAGAGAPTTINDFFLPGSQPNESGEILDANSCNCHSNYDKHVEPEFTWQGGMMAQAMRDPLFTATMVIAEQDAPGSGDLCLRCHTPKGWLEGRSVPTDGSSLQADDFDGVLCHFCHKLVKPSALGVNPYPGDADYTATTYGPDQAYLGILSALPAHSANGMYIVDSADFRRGPYVNPDSPHDFYYAPFSQDASLCGTCHDVSNPVFSRDSSGRYVPNAFNTAAPDFDPTSMLPVERTFSEWSVSAYNTAAGVYAPQFGGNLDTVRTCQDCHMRDATGKGCKRGSAPTRDDLAIHDLTGGNTFVPELIKDSYAGSVNAEALDSGIVRARRMLQLAATVDLSVVPQSSGFDATVTVTNETGHKLPSGYPEGRRIWLNLRAYNSSDSLVYESGAYDTATAVLVHDADVKIYEIKPGISPTLAPIVGETAGPSFHFVLNDTVYKDNRIPPRGFTNAAFDSIQSPPVAHSYADGQYWDVTNYTLPGATARVEAALYYQTVSKEYIDFLKLENVTDNTGDSLYTLWQNNGKSMPELIDSDTATVTPNDDSDGDGVPDSLDNCPAVQNPSQTDDDDDGFGAACDCDDTDSLIHPNTTWYVDDDGDGYGDTASTLTQCEQPTGYVSDSTDCDDSDPAINPATVWYEDSDGDGYGDTASTLTQCEQPTGYVSDSTDCDDSDPAINPATVWYEDSDGDTYGNPAVTLTQCEQPTDYVLDSLDCDDTDPNIHPDITVYADSDGDSYGDPSVTAVVCTPPAGWVLDNTDCDDGDATIHPLASEICNGTDDNCSGTSDEGLADTDNDGWGAACDNCPDAFNPGQEDADSNGVGDVCDTAACPVAITGDVNLIGDLTSADIIYLVNYVFKAGTLPMPCEAAGDTNCSGSVTSADIIQLVGHIFKGDDPPCDVCTLIPGTWTCP